MRSGPRQESGFTIVEMIITTCIVAVLASIAISSYRDFARRAKMSEIVLATGQCKNAVQENYPVLDTPLAAGRWGCEGQGTSYYAGAVETSTDGVIRVLIRNLDSGVNDHYIYLIPTKADGVSPLQASSDVGTAVRGWMCGSDWLPVRNASPANCRADTTSYLYSTTFN